jgi:DNA-binding FrmR family transcriptional regulator
MADRGYTASKDQLTKRLARIEGQVRGESPGEQADELMGAVGRLMRRG